MARNNLNLQLCEKRIDNSISGNVYFFLSKNCNDYSNA